MAARQTVALGFSLLGVAATPAAPPSAPSPISSPLAAVELCNELAQRTGNYSQCLATNPTESDCDPASLNNCNCVVINPTAHANASAAVRQIDHWEVTQAWLQLGFSCLSLLLGGALMLCFAIWPELMCVYPLTLAFWIYASDFVLTLQLLAVSALRIAYTWDAAALEEPWPLTSNTACLCDFNPSHPGCKCDGGIMSFLLQAGLVGSATFYIAMVHNLYRSVTDPFTRPASRLRKYTWLNALVVCALSVPYLVPPSDGATQWGGYGYRRDNLMCWSPDRYGVDGLNNPQAFVTAIVPISTAWLLSPLILLYTQRLLRLGGAPTRAMLQPRESQLRQGRLLVRVVSLYWVATGLVYSLGWVDYGSSDGAAGGGPGYDGDTCEDRLAWAYAELNGGGAARFDGAASGCLVSLVLRNIFSSLLCLGGTVNAIAGFVSNRAVLCGALAAARARHAQRLRGWLRARGWRRPVAGAAEADGSGRRTSGRRTSEARRRGASGYLLAAEPGGGGGGGEAAQDISASLRLEIVTAVMRGIQQTTRAAEPAARTPSPPPPDAGCGAAACIPHSASEPVLHSMRATRCPGAAPGSAYRSRNDSGAAAPADGVPLLAEAFEEVSVRDLTNCFYASDGAALEDSTPSASASSSGAAAAAAPGASGGGPTAPLSAGGEPSSAPAGDAPARRFVRRPCAGASQQRVVFKEYAPRAWQWLRREVYGVTADRYVAAYGEEGAEGGSAQTAGLRRVLANFSEAKGGGFFFFSPDKQYMVKTMTSAEHRALLHLLPHYCAHMRSAPRSLITRVSGMYSIAMYGRTVHFLVMDFLFWEAACPHVDQKFDLKGSWVDRNTPSAAKVRKDSDWGTQRLQIGADAARQLLRQAGLDASFLAARGLMDYSLLLGIHSVVERRLFDDARPPSPVLGGPATGAAAPPGAPLGELLVPPPLPAHPSASWAARGAPISPAGPSSPKERAPAAPRASACATSASLAAAERSGSEHFVEASRHKRLVGPSSFSAEVIEGPGLYRLGIIDILQKWDLSKRLERLTKIVCKCRCAARARNGMSALEPGGYARRFHQMVGLKLLRLPAAEVEQDWEAIEAFLEQRRADACAAPAGTGGGSARATMSNGLRPMAVEMTSDGCAPAGEALAGPPSVSGPYQTWTPRSSACRGAPLSQEQRQSRSSASIGAGRMPWEVPAHAATTETIHIAVEPNV